MASKTTFKTVKNKIPDLLKKIKKLNDQKVEIGYFEEQGKHPNSDVGYAQMAAWLEYGTIKTRPYPLFHRVIEFYENPRSSKIIKKALKDYFKVSSTSDYTVVLKSVGQGYLNIIKRGMGKPSVVGNSNAPSTIAIKGKDSPWIDTGILKSKISYKFNGQLFTP